MLHIDDAERRRRLATRHALAPAYRVTDPVDAARAVVALHATDASTVHLSVQSRSETATVEEIDRALYDDRSLVKQLAMRRTLFAFPRDLLPAVWGSASARVAEFERRRIAKDIVAAERTTSPDGWLAEAATGVLHACSGSGGLTSTQIAEQVPMIAGKVAVSPGTKWGGDVPLAPRILTWLGARGLLVRGPSDAHWRLSRPQWLPMDEWVQPRAEPLDPAAGYAELVTRWLARFGPGTEDDLVWWLGATKRDTRAALHAVAAVAVSLDDGRTGWVLPGDDAATTDEVDPWAALLPTLDPTTMGWRHRHFYLDPTLAPYLFDSVGNGGTTAWWDGRIVGAWVQDDEGRVEVVTHGRVERAGVRALAAEADRLTAWLDGVRIANVYKSAIMKGERLP